MNKRVCHSHNLSNSDATEKRAIILSISCQCQHCPPSGGTQKTEDSGAGWDRAYSEGQYLPSPPSESTDRGLSTDGDLMASASSSSTAPGSSTHIWHGLTPPACDVTYTGMDSTVYMPVDEPTGLE